MSFEYDFTGLMRKKETGTDQGTNLEIGIAQKTEIGQEAATAEERNDCGKEREIGAEIETGTVIEIEITDVH